MTRQMLNTLSVAGGALIGGIAGGGKGRASVSWSVLALDSSAGPRPVTRKSTCQQRPFCHFN